jgi:hypothetical protein
MHRRVLIPLFLMLCLCSLRLTAQATKQVPLSSLGGYWQLDSGNDVCPAPEAGSDEAAEAASSNTPSGLALLQIQISSDEFKASCIRGTHVKNLVKFFADGQEYPNESSSFAEKIMTKATWDENTLTYSGSQSFLFGDSPKVDFVYSRWTLSDDEKILTVHIGEDVSVYHRREAVTKNIYWLLAILPAMAGMVLYLIMSGNNEFLSTLADLLGLFAGVALAVVILIEFSGSQNLKDLARVLLVIVLGTGMILWWIKSRTVEELDTYNFDVKKWST